MSFILFQEVILLKLHNLPC